MKNIPRKTILRTKIKEINDKYTKVLKKVEVNKLSSQDIVDKGDLKTFQKLWLSLFLPESTS